MPFLLFQELDNLFDPKSAVRNLDILSIHFQNNFSFIHFIKVPHPGYFSDFTEFENETKGSTMDYDCKLGREIKEEGRLQEQIHVKIIYYIKEKDVIKIKY